KGILHGELPEERCAVARMEIVMITGYRIGFVPGEEATACRSPLEVGHTARGRMRPGSVRHRCTRVFRGSSLFRNAAGDCRLTQRLTHCGRLGEAVPALSHTSNSSQSLAGTFVPKRPHCVRLRTRPPALTICVFRAIRGSPLVV